METKTIRLSPKKNGKGYTTSYSINIGSAEAKSCGFINSDGKQTTIEKIIDSENNQIIIRLKAVE